MEELVTFLARALVDRPDQVELRAQAVDGGTVLELKVAHEGLSMIAKLSVRPLGSVVLGVKL